MNDLVDRAKSELKNLRGSAFFWIFLVVISVGLGVYHEQFETKVIKLYQIFYFLAIFFVLAFLVEWLERRKIVMIIEEMIEKLKELADGKEE